MKALKKLLHFSLIIAIVLAGAPYFVPGDANRDSRIDLADAILRVQGVEKTVTEPAAFRENIEDALVTLAAVAGFRKVIRTDREGTPNNHFQAPPALFASAGRGLSTAPVAGAPSFTPFVYQSPEMTPPTPPPLNA